MKSPKFDIKGVEEGTKDTSFEIWLEDGISKFLFDSFEQYTHYEIEATLISNNFETGQNFRKIKQSTGVFLKKIEKISNNSNTYKQQ